MVTGADISGLQAWARKCRVSMMDLSSCTWVCTFVIGLGGKDFGSGSDRGMGTLFVSVLVDAVYVSLFWRSCRCQCISLDTSVECRSCDRGLSAYQQNW